MTSNEHDYLKHFGVGIPEEPTEHSIRRVLACMVSIPRCYWITTNRAEIDRLRGTPGEPVPIKEAQVRLRIMWLDSKDYIRSTKDDTRPALVDSLMSEDVLRATQAEMQIILNSVYEGSAREWDRAEGFARVANGRWRLKH